MTWVDWVITLVALVFFLAVVLALIAFVVNMFRNSRPDRRKK